jgi:hypothetical protein
MEKHIGLLTFIKGLQSQGLQANQEVLNKVNEKTETMITSVQQKNVEIMDLERSFNVNKLSYQDKMLELEAELESISPELTRYTSDFVNTMQISGIRLVASQVVNKNVSELKGLSSLEIEDMLEPFEDLVDEYQDFRQTCIDLRDRKDQLLQEIDATIRNIDATTTQVYQEEHDRLISQLDKNLGWYPLALAGKQQVSNHGAFRFACCDLAEKLNNVVTQVLRKGNSITVVENSLAVFFPSVLLKEGTKHSMVQAVNNPKPNKNHKECKRYRKATKRSNGLKSSVQLQKSDEILSVIQQHIINFLFDLVLFDSFNTGDPKFDKRCESVDKYRIFTIIDRLSFDINQYMLDNFNPQHPITHNAKGGPRECLRSEIQQELIDTFKLEEDVA